MIDIKNYKKVAIDDIINQEDFDPSEMIEYMKSKNYDLKDNEDAIDMARVLTMQQYNIYSEERKNFSEESEKLMERMKKGHRITDDEAFFLFNTEEYLKSHKEQLKAKKRLETIKESALVGQIKESDLLYLFDVIEFDDSMKNAIYTSFSNNGLIEKDNSGQKK